MKTSDSERDRGFESHPLRHNKIFTEWYSRGSRGRFAKSLGAQACVGSNPTHSATQAIAAIEMIAVFLFLGLTSKNSEMTALATSLFSFYGSIINVVALIFIKTTTFIIEPFLFLF